jgi:hypothetical protein
VRLFPIPWKVGCSLHQPLDTLDGERKGKPLALRGSWRGMLNLGPNVSRIRMYLLRSDGFDDLTVSVAGFGLESYLLRKDVLETN